MSIEPRYPKVLKQKLMKKQQGTMSTKNICCGGFYQSHSPEKSVQNIGRKENKLLKMFTDTEEVRVPRREMKSVNNIERHQAVSIQKPFIDKHIVNYTRVNNLSFVPLENNNIQKRRVVQQSIDKQKLNYLSQINQLQRKVVALQAQNSILRQKQQLYTKIKAENNHLIQMYNTKLYQAEALKKNLNFIHQTVLKPNNNNNLSSIINTNDQQKQQIRTCNSQWFKDFSITDHQKPSKRNSFSNPFTNPQSTMKYSPSISKFQQSSLPTPQLSLQDQMKKLRSVYQKSDSKSSLNISPETQLMEITRIPEFNFDQIISEIQQINLDNISVSVQDIRDDDLTYSNVIKRLQDYTPIGNDKKRLFE